MPRCIRGDSPCVHWLEASGRPKPQPLLRWSAAMMNESWPMSDDVMTGGLSGNWQTPVDNVSSFWGRVRATPGT